MSANQFMSIFFGTILIVFVFGGFLLLVRYVRNQYFPQEKSDRLNLAMMEMQKLQAQLEATAEEGDEAGEGEGEAESEAAAKEDEAGGPNEGKEVQGEDAIERTE